LAGGTASLTGWSEVDDLVTDALDQPAAERLAEAGVRVTVTGPGD